MDPMRRQRPDRFALLLAAALATAATIAARAAPPSPDYELLYEDNFDGSAVDEKVQEKVPFAVNDATAAGRLGCVSNQCEAVGEVVVPAGDPDAASVARSVPR